MNLGFHAVNLAFRFVLIRFSWGSESQEFAPQNPLNSWGITMIFRTPFGRGMPKMPIILQGFLRFSQGSACIPTTRNLKNVMKGYEFLACPSGQGASRAARNPSISLGFIRFREGRRIPRFHVQKHQFRLCFNKGFVKAALAWIVVPENINLDKLL